MKSSRRKFLAHSSVLGFLGFLGAGYRGRAAGSTHNRDCQVRCNLVMLDREGYLALFERTKVAGALKLLPPKRVFCGADGKPLRLNAKKAGASGRRKFCVVDFDGDGKLDFLVNGSNVSWLRQTECRDVKWYFEDRGPLDSRRLAGHTTCPIVVDFDNNGISEVVIGAEDGHFYYLRNPRARPSQEDEGLRLPLGQYYLRGFAVVGSLRSCSKTGSVSKSDSSVRCFR